MNVEIRCSLIFVLKTTIEVELAWLQVTGRNTAVLFFFVVFWGAISGAEFYIPRSLAHFLYLVRRNRCFELKLFTIRYFVDVR